MSAILTIMFLAAGVLTAVMLDGLALVIAGIHGEERRMNLSAQPRTTAEILARKILVVHISQPGASRIFAAQLGTIACQARPRTQHHHPPSTTTTERDCPRRFHHAR